MAGHRFCRTHRDIFRIVTKNPFEGARFDYIADGRGRTVRVYVADVFRFELAILDRGFHYTIGAVAISRRLGDVVSVAGHAVAHDFGEDGSIAFLRVLEGFQDENTCAFADDEAVAAGVERAAGVGGIFIASGKGLHGSEAADAHGSDGGFRAAADHHFRGAALDDLEGIADGVGGGGAGGGGGRIRSFGTVTNGNVAGSEIDDGGRDEKRGDFAGSALD